MEHEGVRISSRNLRTFPWVSEREADGRLKLHGAYFAIADGVLASARRGERGIRSRLSRAPDGAPAAR